MQYAPNPHRTALHNEPIEDGPLTDRQRAIADAVRHCHALSDFAAAPRARTTTLVVAHIPYGYPDDLTVTAVRRGIAQCRAELDKIEGVLAAYGAQAFRPTVEPVASIPGSTRHEIVTRVLRALSDTGRILVRAGDRRVVEGPDGAYRVA